MLFNNELFETGTRLSSAHWSEVSEQYATGEVLHSLLNEGMHITGVVFLQQKPLSGGRRAHIYLVNLQRHDAPAMRLALVENPYVTRLLHDCGAQIIHLNWRKDSTRRAR
ncbi:MAG TPA: hypothetical protein VER79_14265 [Candidatus Limnocylindrales bacterium]|nr:hypothetical protein [Candidatus Limnocylindrales bacterium]